MLKKISVEPKNIKCHPNAEHIVDKLKLVTEKTVKMSQYFQQTYQQTSQSNYTGLIQTKINLTFNFGQKLFQIQEQWQVLCRIVIFGKFIFLVTTILQFSLNINE